MNVALMRKVTTLSLVLCPALLLGQKASEKAVRPADVRCAASPNLVGSCFTFHGRLSFYNGTPGCRIWRVGTKRILGILDLAKPDEYNENPTLPDGLECYPGYNTYADFTVCPFTTERAGEMQMVCVDSAANIVTEVWTDACELLRVPAEYDGMQINVHGKISRDNTSVMTNWGCSGSLPLTLDSHLQNDQKYKRLLELLGVHTALTVDVRGRFHTSRVSGDRKPAALQLVVESVLEIEDESAK
jgi:hypothetical protein